MRERPILMSGHDVRAILEGRETVTRRLVLGSDREPVHGVRYFDQDVPVDSPENLWRAADGLTLGYVKCPYGSVGDRLWVRETFTIESSFNMDPYEPPFQDGRPIFRKESEAWGSWWEQPHYRATDPEPELTCDGRCEREEPHVHWTPSIHMPRWASRITLEITDVRVQRLQEISEEDARAEGVDGSGPVGHIPSAERMGRCRYDFATVWDEIYGKRAPWDSSPWVWAVTFRQVPR